MKKMSTWFKLPVCCMPSEIGGWMEHVNFGVKGLSSHHYDAIAHAINNHDRLTEENAKLRQEKENLLHELCSIQNACIGQIAMGYNLDAERIGHDISVTTGMTNPELNELLNQLKDQNSDK